MRVERGLWAVSLVWLAGSACSSSSGADDGKRSQDAGSETETQTQAASKPRTSKPSAAQSGETSTGNAEADMDAGTGAQEPEAMPDTPEKQPGTHAQAGAAAPTAMTGGAGRGGAGGAAGSAAGSGGMGGMAGGAAGSGGAIAGAAGAEMSSSGGMGGSPAPRDEPATAEKLGKRLFEDKSLSATGSQSCASCHDAARAFTGSADAMRPDFPVARGAKADQLGNRNVPTAMYTQYSPPFAFVKEEEGEWTPTGGQFWDGRANNLSEQAAGPFLNPREMAMPDKQSVVDAVHKADYAWMFEELYGAGAWSDAEQAYTHVTDAIAAFEQTDAFNPFSSKFDAYLRGEVQLSEQESQGFALFQDETKGNCIGCHVGKPESKDPHDWLFTDFTYDNLGVPRNADIPDNKLAESYDLGLCSSALVTGRVPAEIADKDAFVQSLCGAFKVPTLRNVARTAPYMHNGYFKQLRDVVDFYVTRDTDAARWYPNAADGSPDKFNDLPAMYKANVNASEVPYDRKAGEQPRLTPAEIDAVVAFLGTLSDGYQAPKAQ